MKYVGYVFTFFIMVFISSIWSGFVFSILWSWFIVSAFSLPEINIPTAIGIALIISYLTHQYDSEESKGKKFLDIMIEATGKAAVKPAFALLVGWIVTLFM